MTFPPQSIRSESTARVSLCLFSHPIPFPQLSFPSALKRPTGPLHHALHLPSQLRYSTCNLLRQHVPKASKSLGFAFEQLVVLHCVLNEFTGVDVRISALLDVAYDVLRDVNMEARCGAG